MINVFKGDGFTDVELTDAFIKRPYQPAYLGSLGIFKSRGVRSKSVLVEYKNGRLALIQSSPRGGPAVTPLGPNKRSLKSFMVPHLERGATIYADEVADVRDFGSETSIESVQSIVQERMDELRPMHEVTLEYHRLGAMKGIVKDADGSTIVNFFTEFGVSEQTAELDVSTSNTAVRKQCIQFTRMIEAELGADVVTGYVALCGDNFFDGLVDSDSVTKTLNTQESATLRMDLRQGFTFGGIKWVNYRGSVGETDFIDTDEAHLIPIGPDIYRTYYAPADTMKAVNTIGLPLYAMMIPDPTDQDRYVELATQSNPLCMNLRPRAKVKLTLST